MKDSTRSENVDTATVSPSPLRHMAQHDGGIERVLKSGILANLFRHAASAIDHHGYLLAALCLQIARYQESALGADFPVDRSQIFTWRIGQQAFEIRAVPVNTPGPAHGFVLMMNARQQPILVGCCEARIDAEIRRCDYSELLFNQSADTPGPQDEFVQMIFPAPPGSDLVLPVALAAFRKTNRFDRCQLLQRRRQFIAHRDIQVTPGMVCQLNVNFGDSRRAKAGQCCAEFQSLECRAPRSSP